MNKMNKLLALLICAAMTLMLMPGSTVYGAETVAGGRFGDGNSLSWTMDSRGFLTISGEGAMPDLGTDGYPWDKVTSVRLYSVVIEEGVTTIGSGAFSGQEDLAYATIPDSVTLIKYDAFFNCIDLQTVYLGSGIETIEWWAFFGCKSLTDVYYNGSKADWIKIAIGTNNDPLTKAEIHFAKDAPPPEITASGVCGPELTWTLDNYGLMTISGSGPMDDMSSGAPWEDYNGAVMSIVIEEGVTTIGKKAFSSISGFTEISLPDGLTTIEAKAFLNCSGLENIIIPETVTKIGGNAFENCRKLTSISIPNSVTELGEWAFGNCVRLADVTLGSGLSELKYATFAGCNSLTEITVPGNITTIGNDAFFNCISLKELTISDGVINIERNAFIRCISLESLILPDSVEFIANSVFSGCENLREISLGSGLTTIDYSAFDRCKSLVSINIPDSVTSIGDGAFEYCTSLVDAVIGNGLNTVPSRIFSGCTSLSDVTLGSSVEIIESSAFNDCKGLTNIVIPASLKTVYSGAFDDCTALTDVYYGGSPEDWDAININSYNSPLTEARIHYNSDGPKMEIFAAKAVEKGSGVEVTVDTVDLPAASKLMAVGYDKNGFIDMAAVRDGKAVLDDRAERVKILCWGSLRNLDPIVPSLETQVLRKLSFDVSASQTPELKNGPANINDGDRSTVWTCNGNGYITADLGQVTELGQINVFLQQYTDRRRLKIKVEASEDGNKWTNVRDEYYGGSTEYFREIAVKIKARYIRINCYGSSTSDWASIAELEIYPR